MSAIFLAFLSSCDTTLATACTPGQTTTTNASANINFSGALIPLQPTSLYTLDMTSTSIRLRATRSGLKRLKKVQSKPFLHSTPSKLSRSLLLDVPPESRSSNARAMEYSTSTHLADAPSLSEDSPSRTRQFASFGLPPPSSDSDITMEICDMETFDMDLD
ncbi:hypothetical protein PQX77_019697 [Marasmius sp. AFHP31]|nr:hypothetical protein PQX77_019697 [Marasmius sp. AFHP31]